LLDIAVFSFLSVCLCIGHSFLELLVEELAQILEQNERRNFYFGRRREFTVVFNLSYLVCLFGSAVHKLIHQVPHHVNHANCSDLLAGHTHDVKTNLVLVKRSLLHIDLLLLCDCVVQGLHPI
jgi:hypothetical protein